MRYKHLVIIILVLVLISNTSLGYSIHSRGPVHQYITNESQNVWVLTPREVRNHLATPLTQNLDSNFDAGDDTTTGSGEEDSLARWVWHFWQPDNPRTYTAWYDDGLMVFQSSYRRALDLWKNEMIPAYTRGDIDEAYYWLGRVAHLLEDASQPSHVLLDCHPGTELGALGMACGQSNGDGGSDDSVLENYTGDNFLTLRSTQNWTGNNFRNQQYNYENLPNMSGFNWAEVDPPSAVDQQNIELFRLFWYTAQKTQYYASDDVDGNNVYYTTDGAPRSFPTDLWSGHNVRMVNRSIYLTQDDITNSGDNVSAESNAMIPHAMRAVAGLYRLFDDAVRIDWPTENHDFRRTGFTLLKGDMDERSDISRMDFVMEPAAIGGQEQVVKAIVADADGNGAMETVSFVHRNTISNQTRIYAVEISKDKRRYESGYTQTATKKWGTSPITMLGVGGYGGAVYFPGTLANIDSDSQKELITGVRNGAALNNPFIGRKNALAYADGENDGF